MKNYKAMINRIVLILLLFCSLTVSAQTNYSIVGRLSDGRTLESSGALFIDDACEFTIVDRDGAPQRVNSGNWSFRLNYKETGYNKVKEGNDHSLSLEMNRLPLDAGRLKRITLSGDRSVYYDGLVVFDGWVQNGDHISLEMPVLLNILPSEPIVEILDMSWSNYDEEYGVYDDARMTLQVHSDRCLRILIEEETPYAGGGTMSYFNDSVDPVNHIGEWEFCDADSYFIFTACNDYGSATSNDTLWVKQAALVQTPTQEDIYIYPNPVIDYLHMEGQIEDISSLIIYDMKGCLVKRQDRVTSPVDLTGLDSGMYYLVLTDNNGIRKVTKKLIKL